jgi:hypothetical protein
MSYTKFRPSIFSRHPSHDPFRRKHKKMALLPFKSVVRFGSSTNVYDNRTELNSIDAIKNSASKLKMKTCFAKDNVVTANWWLLANNKFISGIDDSIIELDQIPLPIVAKKYFGSRGQGNTILKTNEEVKIYVEDNPSNVLYEQYYNFAREYRLHVNNEGCFYTCRKMLKSDAPENARWFRNDSNCIWALESNPNFDKPVNWDNIVSECVKALKSVGLDFGAIDLRVQSATDNEGNTRENPEFIIVEINSAPSMGEITLQKYMEEIPAMLKRKYNNLNN